ncbi:hypothetical protein HK097_004270 [Rhizophlyctis rosea]|uniref:Transmembrane protein 138 n=1 Tax=Rhizophlyctis rosea TaxID=64517 RepID=A0AAD5S1S0_9FUNG|nr:hypothetical protein HK097_004270 [Rhizophlyctis rosea]
MQTPSDLGSSQTVTQYRIQILLLGLNFVILFIRFAHTYPFRVGMVQIIIKDFRVTVWTAGIYAVTLLVYRIYGGTVVFNCKDQPCDIWTDGYQILYTLCRLSAILYYFGTFRAACQICEPKYYKDSEWLRERMRLQR